MEIKIVSNKPIGIPNGKILKVYKLATGKMNFYQVIEGIHAGRIICSTECVEIDEIQKDNKVLLPQEVYEAFERIKNSWAKHLNKDDFISMLLNVNTYGTTGDALVLKKFAATNPYEYVKALANGYKPAQSNIKDEVSQMIHEWLNVEYVDNEKKDIQLFAEKLTNFYKQKLSKTS